MACGTADGPSQRDVFHDPHHIRRTANRTEPCARLDGNRHRPARCRQRRTATGLAPDCCGRARASIRGSVLGSHILRSRGTMDGPAPADRFAVCRNPLGRRHVRAARRSSADSRHALGRNDAPTGAVGWRGVGASVFPRHDRAQPWGRADCEQSVADAADVRLRMFAESLRHAQRGQIERMAQLQEEEQ